MIKRLLPTLLLLTVGTLSYGAEQTVNVGSAANDGTGDTGRAAFQKVNANFDELYAHNLSSATLTLVKSGSSLTPAQFGFLQTITNTGAPTGINNSWVDYIGITDQQDTTGNGDAGQSGGLYIRYAFGVSSKGGKQAFATNLTGVANADSGGTNRFYVGQTSYVNAVANGGILGANKGRWVGTNVLIGSPVSSSSYIGTFLGTEIDMANHDPTTNVVIGHAISFGPSTERAAIETVGLSISGQTSPGLDCGICISEYQGLWPMDANGAVFSDWKNADAAGLGQNVGTVAHLFYFPMLNITSSAIETPGFTVDGSGNVTALSYATRTGAKFPFILGQSAIPFVLPSSGTMGDNGALSAITATASGTIASAYVFAYPGTIGNATAASVTITGTAGQFACTCTGFVVGQYVTLSGTYGGTGTITGYTDPTTYYVSATNGTGTFTLQSSGKNSIVTTAGTPTGITYAAGGGWYYAVGVSTTAYTLKNNLYTTGTPTIPASPTAFATTGVTAYTAPISIAFRGPQYTLTGTSLGLNGGMDVNAYYKYDTSANTKTMSMVMGTTALLNATPTTTTAVGQLGHTNNVGSASVQMGWQTQLNSGAVSALAEETAGATNTGADQPVYIKLTLANAGDSIEIQSYSIEVRPN